jgi:hypothetical protein
MEEQEKLRVAEIEKLRKRSGTMNWKPMPEWVIRGKDGRQEAEECLGDVEGVEEEEVETYIDEGDRRYIWKAKGKGRAEE